MSLSLCLDEPDGAVLAGVPRGMPRNRSFSTFRHEFQLADACDFITTGVGVSEPSILS